MPVLHNGGRRPRVALEYRAFHTIELLHFVHKGFRREIKSRRHGADDTVSAFNGVSRPQRKFNHGPFLDTCRCLAGKGLLDVDLLQDTVPGLVGVSPAQNVAVLVGNGENGYLAGLHVACGQILYGGLVPFLHLRDQVLPFRQCGGRCNRFIPQTVNMAMNQSRQIFYLRLTILIDGAIEQIEACPINGAPDQDGCNQNQTDEPYE